MIECVPICLRLTPRMPNIILVHHDFTNLKQYDVGTAGLNNGDTSKLKQNSLELAYKQS